MLYATETRRLYFNGRRRPQRIIARISTRPHDHHAPKQKFSAAAWERLMSRPDVMYRPGGRGRYTNSVEYPLRHL